MQLEEKLNCRISVCTDSTQASPTVRKKTKLLALGAINTGGSAHLHCRRGQSDRTGGSSCSLTSSTGYLHLHLLSVYINTHTTAAKMPKCPKCEKEVYFGKISSVCSHFLTIGNARVFCTNEETGRCTLARLKLYF